MPTIKTSEFTVLQIVGLDAAVVCNLFPTHLFSAFDIIINSNIVVKFLQNVFLPLFRLFYVCYSHPYAIELEGLYTPFFF